MRKAHVALPFVAAGLMSLSVGAASASPAFVTQIEATTRTTTISMLEIVEGMSAAAARIPSPGRSGSLALIVQEGIGNEATITQSGGASTALVQQIGWQNVASVTQVGGGHRALVSQQGRNNVAIIRQR